MPYSESELARVLDAPLEEVVRNFPTILESLRSSYEELEQRAGHVERELFSTNRELEDRLLELDGLRGHLEAVLESLPCGVVVRDVNGCIVEVNAAAEQLLCLTASSARTDSGTTGAFRIERHEALQGADADGEPHEVQTSDGRRLVLASHYSPVRRRDGEMDGSVEILEDQTERAEMTERMHATDKMAALGTMAAGIAHEIRNPMNAVKGFAALLAKRDDLDPKAQRWCQLIVEASAEADAIIENMLSFGSPQKIRLETIEPDELLESAVRLARMDEGMESVEIRVQSNSPPFLGDQIKLRHAIRNLVANAFHASLEAGHEHTRIDVELLHEGESILIRVDDDGPGIPGAIRNRIFDPFFTEHADGTGLGLALVTTIVHLHGGSVRLSPEASPLGGARFLLNLPYRAVDSKTVFSTVRSAE